MSASNSAVRRASFSCEASRSCSSAFEDPNSLALFFIVTSNSATSFLRLNSWLSAFACSAACFCCSKRTFSTSGRSVAINSFLLFVSARTSSKAVFEDSISVLAWSSASWSSLSPASLSATASFSLSSSALMSSAPAPICTCSSRNLPKSDVFDLKSFCNSRITTISSAISASRSAMPSNSASRASFLAPSSIAKPRSPTTENM
mmetsp:Transcript_10677/g.28386  ORF Transcript_10677/g.28386 Transcript_10677/m.28386 type:complete len:204 (-) Transcript_10677:426-1037(-)